MHRVVLADLDWLPTPPQLERDPELAILAVLHTTLQVAVYALVAAYPQLATDYPLPSDRDFHVASKILSLAYQLRRAISEYRRALDDAHATPTDDDATF